jgi:Mrp family chromosome partitioning ATPase
MRIKFAAFSKAQSKSVSPSRSEIPFTSGEMATESETLPAEYLELIQRLFQSPSVIAIVGGSSQGENGSRISENLAAALGTTGKSVVVVAFDKLLRLNPLTPPHQMAYVQGNAPHVWLWPAQENPKIEFLKSRRDIRQRNWLDCLRKDFDSVLLDCPNVGGAPGVTEVAAMADAVVLAVEAGRTSRQLILQDQQALQLRGARVVGSILIQRR